MGQSAREAGIKRIISWAAVAIAAAMALSGCTAPRIVQDSVVTVATSQAFTSYNDKTSYGNTELNRAIVQATNASFTYLDDVPAQVSDDSFGTAQLLSNDPLTVKFTVKRGVTWSDGVPVDAADLLLAWAANSGTLNTPDFDDEGYVDEETGRYTEPFPPGVVYFDGATSDGLQFVTTMPEISDDGRALTLTYDRYFPDWPLVLNVGLPAHVVATAALNLDAAGMPGQAADGETVTDADHLAAAQDAKDALIAAIRNRDEKALSSLSSVWNSGFDLENFPQNRSMLISTGPYTITAFVPDERLTLTANPRYRGDRAPAIETIVIKFIADPLSQISALRDGEVDVIAPQLGGDVAVALAELSDATVQYGFDGTYEHLDLQFAQSRNGVFGDQRVREAFLKVVPRQQILDAIVLPVQPDALVRDSQLFLPGTTGYAQSVASNGASRYAEVDVAGATALLGQAGVVNPQVCILFDPGNPKRLQEFQLIQQSAALAGIQVTDCSSPDWVNLLGTPGSYDAALFAWNVTNLSIAGTTAIFGTGGRNNLNHYSNPAVDALIGELTVETDPDVRLELRQQIDALLWSDAYGVTLYQNPTVVAFDDTVSGVRLAPLSPGVLWNVWDWKPVKPDDEVK